MKQVNISNFKQLLSSTDFNSVLSNECPNSAYNIFLHIIYKHAWIFNCFYRDMVETINDMECGLVIENNRYNVICYADDLLLTSATSTGLQTLINACQKYVEEHGLCFNPTKTSCTVIGKSPFTTEATFYISGVKLQNAKTFKYLGAELGNLSHSAHVKQRIRATNGAFHKLQAAGLHMRGLSPEACAPRLHAGNTAYYDIRRPRPASDANRHQNDGIYSRQYHQIVPGLV